MRLQYPLFHILVGLSLFCSGPAKSESVPSLPRDDSTLSSEPRTLSPGKQTYLVDPVDGDDSNPAGKPWKTYGKLNTMQLAPGDRVIISPGTQEETLMPLGEGTAENPIIIQFLPGIHTIAVKNVVRLPLFVSNAQDTIKPKPVGVWVKNSKQMRFIGGGVEGADTTTILYDGRMVQIFNDHSEDITFSGLILDLKRQTVSEFRVLENEASQAVIQVAEHSDYAVENGRFLWKGDWGPGNFCQEMVPEDGRCWRRKSPRGWRADGQVEAKATDLGDRKVRLDFEKNDTELTIGHQYHFRNTKREFVGIHNSRCARITFFECNIYALTGMGFISQFTDTITYKKVNVAPPKNTIRTCPAWADIFQFSNCKGDILVDSCRLSGMQDDALNCHGTYLRIIEKIGENQLLLRFIHPQTYGFAAYAPGDEIAVISSSNMREYAGNPRTKVGAVERKSDTDWLVTLDGPMPKFENDDVLDNITWNPNITARNNHINANPVRGFLFATRGKIVVEENSFQCAMQGILVEGDAKHWMESSPIRDMLIQKNKFINCGISITVNIKTRKPEEPVHENIRIINNSFQQSAIAAKGVKGLEIRNNTSTKTALKLDVEASCTEVKIENNNLVN